MLPSYFSKIKNKFTIIVSREINKATISVTRNNPGKKSSSA